MVPGSAVGRSLLSMRFTARMRVAAISYPAADQLQDIYASMIQARFSVGLGSLGAEATASAGSSKAWAALAADSDRVARAVLEVYRQVLVSFCAAQQHHYQFTPRDVTAWVCGLARCALAAGSRALACLILAPPRWPLLGRGCALITPSFVGHRDLPAGMTCRQQTSSQPWRTRPAARSGTGWWMLLPRLSLTSFWMAP